MKIAILFLFIAFVSICNAYEAKSINSYIKIEQLIFQGDFQKSKFKLNSTLKNIKPFSKEAAQLYQLKGDIYKLEGDIDEALVHWKKSNAIRSTIYKKGNYHLVWNYALLSNYHYEKINTPLAVAYADSCSALLKGLRLSQQKEIKIYKIWNILGQSYKQDCVNLFYPEFKLLYKRIQNYYRQSIAFQEKHKTPQHYLAKTYHLLGNSYLDQSMASINLKNGFDSKLYSQALINYEKTIFIWKKLYGSTHYELGKTYFLQAMLHYYLPVEHLPKKDELAFNYFEKSVVAFGVSNKNSNLSKIPNKEDLLMCLKYYSKALLLKFQQEGNIQFLRQAESINKTAVLVWENAFTSYKSKNTNQNLAIYNLIPQQETIEIELSKRDAHLNWSVDVIFEANQKLNYFDFVKKLSSFNKKKWELKSINEVQNQLQSGELLIDFLPEHYGQFFFLCINKKRVSICSVNTTIVKDIQTFNESILSMDYKRYCLSATKTFTQLFKEVNISRFKRLIICPSSHFNNIPFEALLVSSKGVNSKRYDKLDYLIKHKEIQYILSTRLLGKTKNCIPFEMSVFAPDNKKMGLSALPFSQKMVENLEENYAAMSYLGNEATVKSFFTSRSSIVHLSGHGLIDEKHSIFSGLVLSDSLLTLQHVYSLKEMPSLVILNTCNSSLGKIYIGDGVDGFVRAFHAAGASSTISNLWEVDDKASNDLLERFYGYLELEKSTLVALRKAKLKTIKQNSEFAAPYYWAGHQLIGKELSFSIEETPKTRNLIWILGASLIVIVTVFYRKRIYSAK